MGPGKLLLDFGTDFVILSAGPPGAVGPATSTEHPLPPTSLSAFRLVLSVYIYILYI